MQPVYYTTVKTSDEFWQQLIADKLNSENPIGFIGEEAGFTITTNHIPAIREMIELSDENPEEIFEVTITTNDLYNNVIKYLEFRSGATLLNHLEPIYHFEYSEGTIPIVDPTIINAFKVEIIEAHNRLNYFKASFDRKFTQTSNLKMERVSNIYFEYGSGKKMLTTKVRGQPFIEINSDLNKAEDYLPF